ncbi:MAG: AraC family transcriptional regulator [Lysobacterales bacterium CG17_big_fil_post_rev_8_21_14_2_50_64_11]|nr:MAG: AraC family transcriptional regulator [Xanthomonadales bacterium CG17_big_fil_post_rev_8_21_14_2_50_64_11]PIX60741.1 MAG: AraC family transcriptional regulator [Xanthomonadales bacterium CG_4_10_14_3_um_filter_64_11]
MTITSINMTVSTNEDLLSEILGHMQLRASVYANPAVCGDWQIDGSDHAGAQFHLISRGSCYLHLDSEPEPRALRGGDLCVFPRGGWHLLTPERTPGVPGSRHGAPGVGPLTNLVCGAFELDGGTSAALLDALPAVIVVPAEEVDAGFRSLLHLLADEALRVRPGAKVVMDRLADALLVMVLRYHLGHATQASRGILAAIADVRLGRALLAMHQRAGENWSLIKLAECAGMSRTAFVARFTQVLASTPMAYLARLRMAEAQRLFNDPNNSVARVASVLGYETEAAFRRAFKRVTGESPGRIRRRARNVPLRIGSP